MHFLGLYGYEEQSQYHIYVNNRLPYINVAKKSIFLEFIVVSFLLFYENSSKLQFFMLE